MRPIIMLGAALAFFLAQLFRAPLQLSDDAPWLAPLIFLVIWLLIFIAGFRLSESKYLYHGIVSGIIGFLVHSTVDFNFYEAGLSQTSWLIAGCLYGAIILSRPEGIRVSTLKLGVTGAAPIILGSLVIMGILGMDWIPRLMKADRLVEEAQERLRSSETLKIREGEKFLQEASGLTPFLWGEDIRPHLALASFYYRINPEGKFPDISKQAVECINKAISLNPTSAPLYFLKGAIWEAISRANEGKIKETSLSQSILAFQQAARLYPTRPLNFYYLGKVWELAGQISEAKEAYETALKLHQEVGLERLRLSKEVLQDIKDRLGRMK